MRLTAIILVLLLTPLAAAAQSVTFEREGVEYRLELPSSRWLAVARPDVHEHFDFLYWAGYEDGYLRVRKSLVDGGTSPKDLYLRDEAAMLKSLPGYVACSPGEGEQFAGRLTGSVFSYEFTSGGRAMAGRVYYLRVDGRTYYTLHLTCGQDRLGEVGPQADSIARSFRLK